MPPTYQRAAHWVASSTSILLHPLAIQAVGTADCADTVASLIQCTGLHVKPRFPAVGLVRPAVLALEFGRGADTGCNIGVIADGATAVTVLLPAACTVESPPLKLCTVKGGKRSVSLAYHCTSSNRSRAYNVTALSHALRSWWALSSARIVSVSAV